jgi:hypothetical protein
MQEHSSSHGKEVTMLQAGRTMMDKVFQSLQIDDPKLVYKHNYPAHA